MSCSIGLIMGDLITWNHEEHLRIADVLLTWHCYTLDFSALLHSQVQGHSKCNDITLHRFNCYNNRGDWGRKKCEAAVCDRTQHLVVLVYTCVVQPLCVSKHQKPHVAHSECHKKIMLH